MKYIHLQNIKYKILGKEELININTEVIMFNFKLNAIPRRRNVL